MIPDIRRLGSALGAEVRGVDLSASLDDDVFQRIHDGFLEHSVLVFRDQRLEPQAQLAFSKRFGEPEQHLVKQFALPDHPDVFVVSNVKERGKPKGAIRAGQYWHTDLSYMEEPTLASFLHALQVPDWGGDTLFSSMHGAYDELSEPLQRMLGNLRAVHDYRQAYETYFSRFPDRPPLTAEQIARVPPVEHPVVRTHPQTGRKALYVNPGFTRRIVELTDEENEALLAFLFAHITKPQFTYRHVWRAGDLVMWDNPATIHCALADYDMKQNRHMHRTSVRGDRPF